MMMKGLISRIAIILFGLQMAACASFQESSVVVTETSMPPEQTSTLPPTATTSPTYTLTHTVASTPTITNTPHPTATMTVTTTPLPHGLVAIPVVVGMHYKDARQLLLDSGLTFFYYDVFDLEQPVGTVIGQIPAPGTVKKRGTAVVLYRAFRASEVGVGQDCRPLRLQYRSGKLLFSVYLDEGERYKIKTDFPYGRTVILDYRMVEMVSFYNNRSDFVYYEPQWSGWYIISLGPYQISQAELDNNPTGVPVGCLWVLLP
jgi:hypothetical protein